ncbi:hypothetical protein RB653_005250 [Dictyostelium firmibasis]|uniref:Uncharacterized protein n=1 Tax=Dictyostelium firmibasis TaxID=79012 RepID=A0AAN7U730_9MYCE
MKILFVLIVLFNLILLIKGQCTECKGAGEKCKKGQCGEGLVCISNTGSFDDAVCSPLSQDKCDYFHMCDYSLTCVNGVCIDAYFSVVGDPCEKQTDCYGNFTKCTNNICTNPTNQCSTNSDCRYNQECINKSCTNLIGLGKNCSLNDDDCAFSLSCQKTYKVDDQIGTCQNIILANIGASCGSNFDCNFNDGLYCSNSICEKYVENIPTGNCTTDNSICKNYMCSCNGECLNDDSTPEFLSKIYFPLLECANENQCSLNLNSYSSSSCLSKKCGSLRCKLLKTDVGDPNGCDGYYKTLVQPYCDKNNSSKINGFSLMSILLVMVITLFF